MLLAGDIGGTKVDLAVYSPAGGPRAPLAQAEFPSASYPSLAAMAKVFLGQAKLPVDTACFGVAGPVIAGRVRTTNLPWVIEEAELASELGLRSVHLLNDLEAIALAVPRLQPDDLQCLNKGAATPGGAIAVIAPGTGLGEAFLTWDGTRYRACASEGGHADFAPTTPAQIGLLEYLAARFGHVSFERVCSGLGIPNIYDYLLESGCAPETPEVARQLAEAPDRTPVILNAAQHPFPDKPCPLCAATLDMFVSILGAEASNLALKVLATGGVYLGGGIPLHIMPALEDGRFMRAFQHKGRFSELAASLPVNVIVQRAGILGAASYGLEAAEEMARRR